MVLGVLVLLASAALAVVYLRRLLCWEQPTFPRADSTAAPWFQLATYDHGRVTHLTPMKDGLHTEDENGECTCRPSSGGYRTNDDHSGVLYVHHVHDERLERAGR